jgi:predicted small lipoprotein YifL
MKNLFKLAFVALALATTVSACNGDGDKGKDTTVVDSNVTVDSSITVDSTVTDTVHVDTAAKM